MLRKCRATDTQRIYFIINEAARAYRRVIPDDCYHQPYMSGDELEREMKRITFYVWEANGELVGVAGLEVAGDVSLVRHTYVLPEWQKQGVGSRLLTHLKTRVTTRRLLVGTWADAQWAIRFYQKHGFRLLPDKETLLQTYWDIPQQQVETSVVLGFEMTAEQTGNP